jgi:hypothetical protein
VTGVLLLAVLAACTADVGGLDASLPGPRDAGPRDAGGVDAGTPDAGLSCAQIEDAYQLLVMRAKTCTENTECQILSGSCQLPLQGCWELVNMSLTQEDLSAWALLYGQTGCVTAVCDCPPFPTTPVCNNGTCDAF